MGCAQPFFMANHVNLFYLSGKHLLICILILLGAFSGHCEISHYLIASLVCSAHQWNPSITNHHSQDKCLHSSKTFQCLEFRTLPLSHWLLSSARAHFIQIHSLSISPRFCIQVTRRSLQIISLWIMHFAFQKFIVGQCEATGLDVSSEAALKINRYIYCGQEALSMER